jgi:hypothetical protein
MYMAGNPDQWISAPDLAKALDKEPNEIRGPLADLTRKSKDLFGGAGQRPFESLQSPEDRRYRYRMSADVAKKLLKIESTPPL